MTWSIVRTCRRCGTRAEQELRTPAVAACAVMRIVHTFEHPDGDDGCPECDPELANAPTLDREQWREMVARARGHRPA